MLPKPLLKILLLVSLGILTLSKVCSPISTNEKSFPKNIVTESGFFEANGKGEARVHIQIISPKALFSVIAVTPEQFNKHWNRDDFEVYIAAPPSLRGKGTLGEIVDNLTFIPCKLGRLDLRYKFSFLRGNEVVLEFYADRLGNIYIPSYGKPLSVKEPDWLIRIFKLICLDISPGD